MLPWSLVSKMLQPISSDIVRRLFTTDYYDDNPYLLMTVAQKITPRAIIEAEVRAELAKQLTRPLGSPVHLSPWHKILMNPRQLFHLPAEDYTRISTKVTIGQNAAKPLHLEIPIMITGMSHGGSLNGKIKMALAKGASLAGTCTNTGESTVFDNERNAAKFLIGQYNRGGWLKEPEQLNRLDAIEIQMGQGAWGGAIDEVIPASTLEDYVKKGWNLKEHQNAVIHARMPGVNSTQDFIDLVNRLKSEYPVPVGVKIAASDFIEYELQVISQTNADFIVIDGAEGGTSSSYPTLSDDMGLPTLFALARTVNWLEDNNHRNRFNVIITGGLTTPGHFLKAMALGADAIYIGTIALMASIHNQSVKALPAHTPVQLALYDGKLKNNLNVDEAASSLANFLYSCVLEMKYATQAIGKNSLKELNKDDIVTVDKDLAEALRIRYAGSIRT